jgi:hypothetical protein
MQSKVQADEILLNLSALKDSRSSFDFHGQGLSALRAVKETSLFDPAERESLADVVFLLSGTLYVSYITGRSLRRT